MFVGIMCKEAVATAKRNVVRKVANSVETKVLLKRPNLKNYHTLSCFLKCLHCISLTDVYDIVKLWTKKYTKQ